MREISYVLYVHARTSRALMTRKSCTVVMHNAILRNHLKFQIYLSIIEMFTKALKLLHVSIKIIIIIIIMITI